MMFRPQNVLFTFEKTSMIKCTESYTLCMAASLNTFLPSVTTKLRITQYKG